MVVRYVLSSPNFEFKIETISKARINPGSLGSILSGNFITTVSNVDREEQTRTRDILKLC